MLRLDPYGIQDGVQLGESVLGEPEHAGVVGGIDQQASAFVVEDPELFGVPRRGTGVRRASYQRYSRLGIDRRTRRVRS